MGIYSSQQHTMLYIGCNLGTPEERRVGQKTFEVSKFEMAVANK